MQDTFAGVGISKAMYTETGGPERRFRQHVNPLRSEFQSPVDPLDWPAVYADPTLPLILDIGSGYGRFLLALAAERFPSHNCLGLEIRGTVIERANRWAQHLDLHHRVHFLKANATVSAAHTLATYPGQVDLITILHPDPHWKKRHRKRRVVQPALVTAVSGLLRPGGRLLLQSDVLAVAEDMRDQFERWPGGVLELDAAHSAPGAVFQAASEPDETEVAAAAAAAAGGGSVAGARDGEEEQWQSAWAQGGWLVDRPLGVPTERELHVVGQGLPVYRLLLVKTGGEQVR